MQTIDHGQHRDIRDRSGSNSGACHRQMGTSGHTLARPGECR